MSDPTVYLNPDKYRVALKVATLLDANYVTAEDIKEVLQKATRILKIKYPDIN